MLSYSELLRKTPLNIMRNSKNVRTRQWKYEEALEEGENIVQIMIRSKDPSYRGSGRTHIQVIRYQKDNKTKVNKMTPIWVSCSCENWLYTQEYAVWVNDSTNIIHCNGNFPKIKNKVLKSGLCKHLLKAIPKALKIKPKTVNHLKTLQSIGWKIKK